MDISKLKTAGIMEVPQFCHFTHPALGHPLFADGDELGREIAGKSKFKIGAWSKHAASMAANEWRAQNELTDNVLADDAAFFVSIISAIDGLEIDGRKAEVTQDDLRAIFEATPQFHIQLCAFTKELANFFGKPSA